MDSVLSIKNLYVQLKGREVMRNISFDVHPGDIVLLSGTNGIGKSTLLKSILRLEMENKLINGEIIRRGFGNVLDLNSSDLQRYRSSIAYVQQRDDYAEMGNVQVRDIISESGDVNSGKQMSASEVNELIDKWIPRRSDNSRVFDAKSKPAKFSGGEQRLLSVLSVIAMRSNTDLLLIDEPLNNLDFINARNISNLINKVIRDNPEIAVLMVSHCRIFPFITREIYLTTDGIQEISESYSCHSCFGAPGIDGFYK